MTTVGNLSTLTSAHADPDGDGLTNLEEQRGIMWGKMVRVEVETGSNYRTVAYVPKGNWDGTVELVRTYPTRRDLFVRFTGFEEDYPFALGEAYHKLGIDVHALSDGLIYQANLDRAHNIDTATVELNEFTYAGEDGHIYRRNAGDWSFKTLGYATWAADPSLSYGSRCRLYKETLNYFYEDKTHRDGETLNQPDGDMRKLADWNAEGNNSLDPLNVREDANDNGVLDGGEDKTKDGKIQGDYPVRGMTDLWSYTEELSPFDVNKNGLMELPLGSSDEYHIWQVIKHVATHELGHNIGIKIHTSDPNCVMFEQSNNFLRDGYFSPDAAVLIQIHNQ